MNENCPKCTKGNFLGGFLWGLLIGAGAVYLLKSKKGKKFLKTIFQEGLDLSELIEEEAQDFDLGQESNQKEEKQNKTSRKENPIVSAEKNIVKKVTNGEALTKITKSGRRFFRGIHRRS